MPKPGLEPGYPKVEDFKSKKYLRQEDNGHQGSLRTRCIRCARKPSEVSGVYDFSTLSGEV